MWGFTCKIVRGLGANRSLFRARSCWGGGGGLCNDCAPSVWLGLRATVWRERYCSVRPPLSDVQVVRVIA